VPDKREILAAIGRQSIAGPELPSLEQSWTMYDNPAEQFARVLSEVGGHCISAATFDEANAKLAAMPVWSEARKRVSLVARIGDSTFDWSAVTDPHTLEDVDAAILPGHFAVAENGAVWITDGGIRHRAIYFIPQHLVLVVPADQMVHNMHQAYERLAFVGPGFGTFLSGPSKTADIEQSLVIGAHGPRSLHVILLGASEVDRSG
jgi:L-lactate dehydrogenase complex protein LldG